MKSIPKLNWWKVNSLWILLGLVRIWFYNFSDVALTLLTIITVIEFVVVALFWFKIKFIFWIYLFLNIFVVYKLFTNLNSPLSINNNMQSTISILLFLGLARQVFFEKRVK